MVTKLDLRRNKIMTNELTKTFFDTFGIEGKELKTPDNFTYYPQITDRILLELICILTKFYGELVLERSLDIKDLKEQVLNIFIRTSYKDIFKQQVRTLFEVYTNDR